MDERSIIRTYSELIKMESFRERFEYLNLKGVVGQDTFGFDRYLNQIFYSSKEWKKVRRDIILRDNGCDLGDPDYPINGKIYIHHMNPITPDDLIHRNLVNLMNPEYLVCVSFQTHQAIHYGNYDMLNYDIVERRPGDTCPWKKYE